MTAPKPNIVFRGSPNYWVGRNGYSPIAIVNHVMVGTMESTDGWFKNPASEASSTFGIAKDGRIWQWVKEGDTAWGNGPLQQPDMSVAWIAECANKNINPNYKTFSLEHEGWPGDVFPEAQYQATLALHRWLLATYNIPADRQHINGHYQLMKFTKADCPGPSFPWARLMGDLQTMNPNPNNLNVGKGFLDYLQNVIHEQAATEERYIKNAPGGVSVLRTVQGSLLMATQDVAANGTYLASWTITKLA